MSTYSQGISTKHWVLTSPENGSDTTVILRIAKAIFILFLFPCSWNPYLDISRRSNDLRESGSSFWPRSEQETQFWPMEYKGQFPRGLLWNIFLSDRRQGTQRSSLPCTTSYICSWTWSWEDMMLGTPPTILPARKVQETLRDSKPDIIGLLSQHTCNSFSPNCRGENTSFI